MSAFGHLGSLGRGFGRLGSYGGGTGGEAGPPAWLLADDATGFNFAENLSWDGTTEGTVADGLSCSRSSGKWMRYATAPYYRFILSDVMPLSDAGLLVEDQAVNLVLQSEDFTDITYWGQSNIIAPTKNQTGPDGVSNSACLITENTGTARHGINEVAGNPVSMTNGVNYLGSVIAKAGTCGIIQLTYPLARMGGGGYANFDLTNGVAGNTGGTVAGSGMQAIGGGWYRCWISVACSNSGTGNLNVNLITATTDARNVSFLGTSRNFTLFGIDVVAGVTSISSHITTGLATATRMADVLTLTGAFETAAIAAAATYVRSENNRLSGRWVNYNDSKRVEATAGTTVRTFNGVGGPTATLGSCSVTTGVVKSAFGHDASGMSAVANAGSVVTNATAWGTPSAPVTLGGDTTGTSSVKGWMLDLQWSPTKDQFNGDTTP